MTGLISRHSRWILVLALVSFDGANLGVAWANSNAQPSASLMITHNVTSWRFEGIQLSDERAKIILENATDVLHGSDGAGDVKCMVELVHSGTVVKFGEAELPSVVTSADDFNRLSVPPGAVKVVKSIDWCGYLGTNFVGCASQPGFGIVVLRHDPELEGILWLHEFGHNKGLGHTNQVKRVMQHSIGKENRLVTSAECEALRIKVAGAVSAGTAGDDKSVPTPVPQTTKPPTTMPIEEFVSRMWIHGVPYSEARKYGDDALPFLLNNLNDRRNDHSWANTVMVLGMIGNADVSRSLLDFLFRRSDVPLSRQEYFAKLSVPLALGYMANRTEDQASFKTLMSGVSPRFWEKIDWAEKTIDEREERNRALARKSIVGLALTGRPAAVKRLNDLEQEVTKGAFSLAEPKGRQPLGLIGNAIETNKEIHSKGLLNYFNK